MLSSLIALDERIFAFLHTWAAVAGPIWKGVAIGGVYVVPVVLVWYWFARRRETALLAAITGLLAWLGLNNFIASLVRRERPIPVIDLHFPSREFLFDRPGPSFPSDHAAFLVAITLVFYLAGERRLAGFLSVVTSLTVLARVVTAQHWPGDIVVGAFVGVLAVGIISVIRRYLERWVINPIVKLARRIGL